MKKESSELTKKQRDMLLRLEEMSDEQLDTTDIPEIHDLDGWLSASHIPTVIKKLKEINRSRNGDRRPGESRITREDAVRVQNEILKSDGGGTKRGGLAARSEREDR
ncbi:MAG: hypothetical protein F4X14_16610 [Caldilineaceae bacterium SB0661_bin_32]|uniref:Uncharacterized protein n=1 Tax=Caldilineaceae bacterium SB0661_bin_32 TaxID=2605255 RepID=A0A6B1DA38_9CHLR|nr:hypothetical protein [Caldilineaceae bacterium SB0661_bin_32]